MGQEFWDEIKHGGLRCFIFESSDKNSREYAVHHEAAAHTFYD